MLVSDISLQWLELYAGGEGTEFVGLSSDFGEHTVNERTSCTGFMSKDLKDRLGPIPPILLLPGGGLDQAEASKLAAEDEEEAPGVPADIEGDVQPIVANVRERQVAGDQSRLLARKDRALSRNDALPLDAALISPLASANFKTRTPFRRNCPTLAGLVELASTRFHRRHWIEQSGRAVPSETARCWFWGIWFAGERR